MDMSDDERLERALLDENSYRPAEQYRLLLPLAEAGHPEAMAFVGALLSIHAHRHETYESLQAGPAQSPEVYAADRAEAFRYLQAASDAGNGPASFNLAGMYVSRDELGTWEERKAKAAALYALAHAQGFTAFGHVMNHDAPGQPYLDAIEPYIAPDQPPRDVI